MSNPGIVTRMIEAARSRMVDKQHTYNSMHTRIIIAAALREASYEEEFDPGAVADSIEQDTPEIADSYQDWWNVGGHDDD